MVEVVVMVMRGGVVVVEVRSDVVWLWCSVEVRSGGVGGVGDMANLSTFMAIL